jgi:glycine hydroxymethyltransferase
VDLTPKGLTGKSAEETLDKAGITVNKNAIPYDTQSPQVTSGIRLGTPALTTRGMRPEHMPAVAGFIHQALEKTGDEKALETLRAEIAEFCSQFPLHG